MRGWGVQGVGLLALLDGEAQHFHPPIQARQQALSPKTQCLQTPETIQTQRELISNPSLTLLPSQTTLRQMTG